MFRKAVNKENIGFDLAGAWGPLGHKRSAVFLPREKKMGDIGNNMRTRLV